MDLKLDIYDFNLSRKAVATVSDGAYSYHFLFVHLGDVEGKPKLALFWPEFSPGSFDNQPTYEIRVGHFMNADDLNEGGVPGFVEDEVFYVDASNTLAYAPFRYEGENYREFTPLGWEYEPNSNIILDVSDVPYYISVNPINSSGVNDMNYTGSQTSFVHSTDFLATLEPIVVIDDELCSCVKLYHNHDITRIEDLVRMTRHMYGFDGSVQMYVEISCVICDYANIYGINTWVIDEELWEQDYIKISLPKLIDNSVQSDNYWSVRLNYDSPGWFETLLTMQQYAWIRIGYIKEDETLVKLLGFRTSNIPVTPNIIAAWRTEYTGSPIIDLDTINMNNYPRIINKTVTEVIEMSTRNDSKANITMPIFFSTHPLGSIVVHPAVSENIAINLDYYKSVVDRFYLQIEGVVFDEVARISSGVVFNIKGNLLPGGTPSGTYFILDQNEDMITSGVYQYEY